MTEDSERRADATRQKIVDAAARQFAHRPYSMVSLDDILREAEVTKGAMYFHFSSKQALALAIIESLNEMSLAAVADLLAREMSGLETLIELTFLRAVQDIRSDIARAAVRLLDTLDDPSSVPPTLWQSSIEFVTTLLKRAVTEGDIMEQRAPDDIAKMLVALWVGLRRTNDLDQPEEYLDNVSKAWALALTSFTSPSRLDYFAEFIQRRHALA